MKFEGLYRVKNSSICDWLFGTEAGHTGFKIKSGALVDPSPIPVLLDDFEDTATFNHSKTSILFTQLSKIAHEQAGTGR
jgi:hypothetical protein